MPLYFVLELRAWRARAGTGSTRRSSTPPSQYRVAWNALTRQYRVSSGLFAQTLYSLEEVERFLSRVNSRPRRAPRPAAEGRALRGGAAAAPRRHQLPKPFQVNALASREWTLQSDWYRWRSRMSERLPSRARNVPHRRVWGPHDAALGTRGVRWLLLVGACLGAISLFLLATATANTELFAGSYDVLLVLNGDDGRAADGARRLPALAAAAQPEEAACSARASRCGWCCCSRWSPCCRARSSTRCRCSSSARASRAGSTCASTARSKGGLNLGRSSLDYLLKETRRTRRTRWRWRCPRAAAARRARALNRAAEQAGDLRGGAVLVHRQRARGRRASAARRRRPSRRPRRRCAARGCSRRIRRSSPRPTAGWCCAWSTPVNTDDRLEPLKRPAGRRAGAARRSRPTPRRCRPAGATTRRSRSRARR